MAKKQKSDRDNIERLESIAFWLWEYTCRNPHYRRYLDVYAYYLSMFEEIGELENFQEHFSHDRIRAMLVDPDVDLRDLKDNEFTQRIREQHGERAAKAFYKYFFLDMGFNMRFGRIVKPYEERMDVDEALSKLIAGKEVFFRSKDQYDQYAVVNLRDDWTISIDDDDPNLNLATIATDADIRIDPAKVLTHTKEIGKEVEAFRIYTQVYEKAASKKKIDYDTQLQIYQLGAAGKDFHPRGDVKRLVMLWLWDKAHEGERDGEEPKTFDEVIPLLADRVNAGHLQNIYYDARFRKSRLRRYYQTTEHCINNITVLPLKDK